MAAKFLPDFLRMHKNFESPKFCRHAGLDPASSFIMLLELPWIPAFAGMTSRMNQHMSYQCVKRTLGSQDKNLLTGKISILHFAPAHC